MCVNGLKAGETLRAGFDDHVIPRTRVKKTLMKFVLEEKFKSTQSYLQRYSLGL